MTSSSWLLVPKDRERSTYRVETYSFDNSGAVRKSWKVFNCFAPPCRTIVSSMVPFPRSQVIPVTDHILGTMAGGAADCTFWLRYLTMQVQLRSFYRMSFSDVCLIVSPHQ